jgi:hypothetical protein
MGTSGNASTHENYNEEGANGSQVLTEEQVEALIRSEELAASEGNNADIESNTHHNMEWSSKIEMMLTISFIFMVSWLDLK